MDRENRNSRQNSRQNSQQNHQPNGTSNQNSSRENTNPNREDNAINTESPEYYQIFVERLLRLVSNGNQETVNQLIAIIRSGASQQDIFEALSGFRGGSGSSDEGNKRNAP